MTSPPDPRRHKEVCQEISHRYIFRFTKGRGRYRVWNVLTGEELQGPAAGDTLLAFSETGFGFLRHEEKTVWLSTLFRFSVWKDQRNGKHFLANFQQESTQVQWIDEKRHDRRVFFLGQEREGNASVGFMFLFLLPWKRQCPVEIQIHQAENVKPISERFHAARQNHVYHSHRCIDAVLFVTHVNTEPYSEIWGLPGQTSAVSSGNVSGAGWSSCSNLLGNGSLRVQQLSSRRQKDEGSLSLVMEGNVRECIWKLPRTYHVATEFQGSRR